MSTELISILKQRGVFVAATFIEISSVVKNGYKDVFVRTNDKYASLVFSVPQGSEFDLVFSELAPQTFVILKTSDPSVATSKAGNKYQRWFLVDVFPEVS